MIRADELGRIVFGCGNFGGLGSSPALRGKGDDRARALALLDHARDLGLTRFDTANTYGGGVSETVLGEWLRGRSPAERASLQIATKVGNPAGCPPDERPLSAAQVGFHLDEIACAGSDWSRSGSTICTSSIRRRRWPKRCRRWSGRWPPARSPASASPTPRSRTCRRCWR